MSYEDHLGYLAVEGARVDGVDDNLLLPVFVEVSLEDAGVGIHCNL
jgi:hypothetical protein